MNTAAAETGEATYFIDDKVEAAASDGLPERVVLLGPVSRRAGDDVDELLGRSVGVLVGDPRAELVKLARVLIGGRDAGVYLDGLGSVLSQVFVFANAICTSWGFY